MGSIVEDNGVKYYVNSKGGMSRINADGYVSDRSGGKFKVMGEGNSASLRNIDGSIPKWNWQGKTASTTNAPPSYERKTTQQIFDPDYDRQMQASAEAMYKQPARAQGLNMNMSKPGTLKEMQGALNKKIWRAEVYANRPRETESLERSYIFGGEAPMGPQRKLGSEYVNEIERYKQEQSDRDFLSEILTRRAQQASLDMIRGLK